jgi:hypothetical protein
MCYQLKAFLCLVMLTLVAIVNTHAQDRPALTFKWAPSLSQSLLSLEVTNKSDETFRIEPQALEETGVLTSDDPSIAIKDLTQNLAKIDSNTARVIIIFLSLPTPAGARPNIPPSLPNGSGKAAPEIEVLPGKSAKLDFGFFGQEKGTLTFANEIAAFVVLKGKIISTIAFTHDARNEWRVKN